MATPKQAHTLVSYFGKQYKAKYGFDPKVNRYKARWGFDAILMDMSVDEAKALIDYYFGTVSPSGHDLDWLFYNYDKLAEAKEKTDADRAALAVLREQSKKRAEEWRKKKNGNN
jgi:hypothetical protein